MFLTKSDDYTEEPHIPQESALMLPQRDNSFAGDEGSNSQSDDEGHNGTMESSLVAGLHKIVQDFNLSAVSHSKTNFRSAFHSACVAGNIGYVKFWLESGALEDINGEICDSHGEDRGLVTPLCCAVSSSNCEIVQLLLEYGVDVNLQSGGRAPLHFATIKDGNAACVQILLKGGASHDVTDARGNTPIHLAATVNDADSVATLLQSGADPNIVDASGRTALHIAVAKGTDKTVGCVRTLLDDRRVDVNAQDNHGYTALHLSAMNEQTKIASMLLKYGSDVTVKNSDGTTALSMLARKLPHMMNYLVERLHSGISIHDNDAADANCEIKMNFNVLIPTATSRKNKSSSFSFTNKKIPQPAHIHHDDEKACMRRRKETSLLTCLIATGNKKLLAHPLCEAFLLLKWRRVRKFFLASLLFQMALVALFTVFVVEVYLIRCPYTRPAASPHSISRRSPTPNRNQGSSTFTWFNFVPPKSRQNPHQPSSQVPSPPLQSALFQSTPVPPTVFRVDDQTNSKKRPPMAFKPAEIPGTNEETLEAVAAFVPNPNTVATQPVSFESSRDTDNTGPNDGDNFTQKCGLTLPLQVIWILLIVFISIMAFQEIFQLVHSPSRYVVSSENWAQWLLITSVMITAWRKVNVSSKGGHGEFELEYWQYPAAACGILVAWGLILFQVGRFPSLGLYVEMFGKVAANFGLFILAYACLLIAFALSFCVLFPEHPPFSSVPLSILKVFTMMVGEVDYEDLFYSEERSHDPILFPLTAHLLFGAFVLIMTIVLMNLLVGLAVNDIQGLQKGAKLDRLCRQTALIARFESFIFSRKLRAVLPASLIRVIQENSLLNESLKTDQEKNFLYFYFRPNDPRDRSLPKAIKQAALHLVSSSSSYVGFRHNSSHIKRGTSITTESHNFLMSLEQQRIRNGLKLKRSTSSGDISPMGYNICSKNCKCNCKNVVSMKTKTFTNGESITGEWEMIMGIEEKLCFLEESMNEIMKILRSSRLERVNMDYTTVVEGKRDVN